MIWQVAESAYKNGSPWSLEQFEGLIAFKNVTTLIAEKKGKEIVALVIASKTNIEADIYMLAVKASEQGKGIGQELLQKLIQEMRANDLETIFLEVRESNSAANKVYQRLGFKQIGRRKNYYSKPKEDALMMKLNL
ncbi:MAG: ribosomal protein S18-alanine N-acetyltransferase [Atopostipes suicloacalis]|nr:ribosomal protein S18-alanine N-acetyltransferase [Atopostipes suicloacalis]